MKDWYAIDNIESIDSPALIIYPDRVLENIRILKEILPQTDRLRPHVKTHKSAEASKLLMDAGITKFKCATIAEAEMLAMAGAPDILMAYQPVGPKAERFLLLMEKYPDSAFSCLVDNDASAHELANIADAAGVVISVFIDLNCGMNRTGIMPAEAMDLFETCEALAGLQFAGLHAYDGHLRDKDVALRTRNCNESYAAVERLRAEISKRYTGPLEVVAGGTPTFPIHANRENVSCSPGTFIYWDLGYQQALPEQPFIFAALVITRVISKPTPDTLCLDLGHKSIASENILGNRVRFLNAPELEPIGHSEEHLLVRTAAGNTYHVGDVLFGVPFHICPTCALYDQAVIVENHRTTGQWNIISRNRIILT